MGGVKIEPPSRRFRWVRWCPDSRSPSAYNSPLFGCPPHVSSVGIDPRILDMMCTLGGDWNHIVPTVAPSDSIKLCPHSHRTSKSNPDPRPHWKHTEAISVCLSFMVSSCISSKGKPFTVTVCLKPRDVESNGNPYPLFVAFLSRCFTQQQEVP